MSDWRDEVKVVGNAIYAKCADCGGVVRVNKRVFGSLHLCTPPEKR